jgi:hypothetical protein
MEHQCEEVFLDLSLLYGKSKTLYLAVGKTKFHR